MWLNRFFGRRNREVRSNSNPMTARRRPTARRLQLEPLEQRRLLTVNALLDGPTGHITISDGSVTQDNDVTLSHDNQVIDQIGPRDGLLITAPGGVSAGSTGMVQVDAQNVFVPSHYDSNGGAAGGVPVALLTSFLDIDLQSGDDTLIFANDFASVPVVTTVNAHGGDNGGNSDVLQLNATSGQTENISIAPTGIGADELSIGGYAGVGITSRGYEIVDVVGEGSNDTLAVDPGFEANTTLDVAPSDTRARLASDRLATIDFTALSTFTLSRTTASPGTDTVYVNELTGIDANVFNYDASPGKTLIAKASGGQASSFTIEENAGGDIEVDATPGIGVPRPLVITSNPSLINVQAEGGDDDLTVDTSNGLIGVPIQYDGGAGTDSLLVQGATGATNLVYSPGPAAGAGSLDYNSGAMTIDFTGLEPIVDLLVIPTLTVNGTNADNAINYSQGVNPANGLVSVDGFETIEFNGKTNLILNGQAGSDTINLNNPTIPTGPLATITVNGGDPTGGSDTVVVNGTVGSDGIGVGGLISDGAVVTGAQPVPVTVTTAESLVIDGQGGNDTLTYNTPAAEVTLSPGATADVGTITADTFGGPTLLPLTFENLGGSGGLTFAGPGVRADGLDILGTDNDDQFNMDAAGTVQIVKPAFGVPVTLPISTPGVAFLRMMGRDGDDTFNVPGNHPFTAGMEVQGGNPGSGSDVLNFNGSGAGAVAVNLMTKAIQEAGSAAVDYTGIETLNVNAAGQVLSVQGTANDDVIEVTPYGGNAGTLQANGQAPVVNYSNVSANTVSVDPLGGQDALLVKATVDADAITVNVPAGTVDTGANGGIVSFALANTEALRVHGLAGDDAFTVTPGAIPVSLDGGDPIAASDTVTIDAAGIGPVTFNAGPLADEGSFSFGGADTVSYVNLEGATVTNTGVLTVNGTNGDDDITIIGTAANAVDVSINAGPVVSYSGVTDLTVDGLNGDDDIDIDINNLSLQTFNVIGGLPSADPDTVTVTGVAGPLNDNASWAPLANDGGTFIAGAQTVNISGVERVIYDGEGGDETLTVLGFAPANRFIHTPGGAGDEGVVSVTDIGLDQSGLGIEYVDLGLQGRIDIVPGGLADILVAFGTASNDVMNVAPGTGAIGLQSNFGNSAASAHVPIVPMAPIQTLILDTLDGDDTFNVTGPQPNYTTISLEGGDPSASDVANLVGDGSAVVFSTGTSVQTVTGGGFAPLTLTGIEEVNLNAVAGAITVNGTAGPDAFGVTPTATNTAQIAVDGVNQVLNTNNTGPLTIAEGTAGDGDTVTAYGTSASDTIGVIRAATTTVNVGGLKQIDVNGTNVEALNIHAGQGDDQFNVSGIGGSPLTIDGGDPTGLPLPHDTVVVTFANPGLVWVDPGATPDAGFIDGPTPGEDIYFKGLEALGLTGVAGSQLTVEGTFADDAITQVGNNVAVNDRATVGFFGFDQLVLDGLAGDDTFSVDPTSLFGPTSLTVIGADPSASDELIINGTFGNDNITFTPLSPDSGNVTVGAAPVVNFNTIESVVINAGADTDNDTMTVATTGNNDRVVYTPGDTIDSANVRVNSFVPMSFLNIGAAGAVTISDPGGVADELIYEGTAASDTFTIAGAPVIALNSQVAVGTVGIDAYRLQGLGGDDTFNVTAVPGVQTTVEGDGPGASDVLNFTSTGPTAVDLGNSLINDAATAIVPDVAYSGIETLNVNAINQTLTVFGSATDDTIRVTPFGGFAGTLQANGQAPVLNYSNVNANTINVDPLGGQNVLVVNATPGNDAVLVNVPAGSVDTGATGGIVNFALGNTDALHVNGREGDDTFAVTPGAIPVSINGGDPIGGSDDINLIVPFGAGTATFHPGPLADEGSFTFSGAGFEPVSFDNIEGGSVDLSATTGSLLIHGTNGDDDITVVGDDSTGATDDLFVSINNGPSILYLGVTDLMVDGLNGDDDIDVDINDLALGNFDVVGGLPSTDLDTVTVTGVFGTNNDSAVWTPNMVDGGTFFAGAQLVDIMAVERLIYDGEDGNEILQVDGAPAATRFVHTPGGAGDEGTVSVTDIGNDDSGLGIEYVDLGLQGQIHINGLNQGGDILVAFGTASNDAISVAPVSGIVTLQSNFGNSAAGNHVPLVPLGPMQSLILDGLDGDDTFNVAGPQGIYTNIRLEGGDPSASDVANLFGDGSLVSYNTGASVQTVTGGGFGVGPLTIVAIEEVNLNNAAGPINVNGTAGPNAFHVTPTATNTAQILVDGVNQVLNTDNTGLLTITEGTAGDGDTVTVYGTSANDTINVVRGPTTQVTVVGLKQIDVLGANVEALNVDAGQGDDLIDVSGAGGSPLTVVGGDPTGLPGHDTVQVNFANVGMVTVDPGATPDAGFIHGPTAAEDIAFEQLEALYLVGVGDSTLVVYGTAGDDSITQLGNAVSVNDRAVVGFQDFPTLTLAALPGDDTVSVTPTTLAGVTTLNVVGGEPTASDELIVNGTDGNDNIIFTPTDPDTGSVAVNAAPIVNFTTTESVVINAGASNDNDTLTVVTTSGDDQVVYTPGDTIDSAAVRVNSFVPMRFLNLGAGGSVTIDDSAGGTDDEVIYVGTQATDTFTVPGLPFITLNDQLDLDTTDINFYRLQGLGGDDTFNIMGVDDIQIAVQGDEPGNGSDVLNFTSIGATTIDLGNSEIDDVGVAGAPDVVYSGIETINADADSQVLTVLGTAADDTIRVTPFGSDAGTLQANGVAPVVNYVNVNLNTINVDPLGGEDRVVVNATADADAVSVDVPGGTVDTGASGGIVAFTLANTEALHVNGLEGDDSFDVTPGSIPVSIDGGDPIGASDVLNLLPNETPTFAPGPEADEGSFSFATDATVSFDRIEAATVDLVNVPAQDAIILGTGADDDITAIGHPTNNNEVDVQVNAGPIVTYTNALMLDLEAGNGDDDVDLDINNSTLGVTFNVDGGLPSTNGDIVTVTGVPGLTNDNALWEPTANTPDEGQMTVGGQTINIVAAERVIYDGENEDELLTVLGTGAADRFVHTPGAARDAGAVTVDDTAATLLGIEYVNLGLLGQLQIDANGDDDTLVARGTDGSDVMDVDFPAAGEINVTLHSGLGQHVVLQAINGSVENFEIRSLEGDDDVNVAGPVYNPLAIFAGGPGAGSDTLNLTADAAANAVAISQVPGASDDQWIAGLGAGLITSNGVELITLTGTGNDTLNVLLGAGDDTARVARGDGADVVTSSSLPAIEFTGLDGMTVTGEAGSDEVTFATWNLAGAVNTNYAAVLGAVDTLVIEGADGAADAYTLTEPAAGQVQVDDANGTNVRVTGTGMGRVQMNTLGGDDAVTVTNTGGLIDALIGYDGGTGSDVLIVDGAWDVTNATYSPGPAVTEGRLTHDSQTIDFVNLEPVLDWTIADTLTVNGTNADNAITYTEGQNSDLISVDAYETIEFANKTNLVLNGLAGDDVISLNDLSGATSLTSIAVDGGAPTASDTLIVTGAAGDGSDTVTWTPSSADAGMMTLAGPTIYVTTTEQLVYDGQSDDDSLIVSGLGLFVHTPGAAIDAGSMGLTTGGMTMLGIDYENLGGDGDVTADGSLGASTLVALGTGGSDMMVAAFTALDAIDIDLTSAVGTHVDLLSMGVENYQIRPEEGDDDVTVVAPLLLSGSFAVMGGGPGSSDTLNFDLNAAAFAATIGTDIYDSGSVDVVVGGILADVYDFELIRFVGDDPWPGGNDDLTYDLGVGDHDIRIEDAPALTPVFTLYDRVTSSVLPIVEYGNMNSFTVLGQAVFGIDNGANEVTFATGGLIGAANYATNLNELDTLIIEGESGSADHIILSEPDGPFAPGTVTVTDFNAPIVPIAITDTTIAAGPLGSVVINTLGGDDLIEVDVNNGLIRVPITVDGGANSDSILVQGDPSGAEGDDLDQVEYMPGPDIVEGRLLYDLDWTSADTHEMVIDFLNMEPVVDLTYATIAVTVYGTNADNAINFSEGPNADGLATATGLVSVDGFETFEFANKLDVLEIIGLAGDDVINLNYQGTVPPDGLGRVWVEGNDPTASDKLVVNAFDGITDTLIVTPGDLGAGQDGRVSGPAILPVDYLGIEELALVGQLADFDTFEVDGTTGYDLFEYFSGDTPDTGMVRGLMDDASFALPEIAFQGMHPIMERSFGMTTFDPADQDDFVFYATSLDDEIEYYGPDHELTNSIDGSLVTAIQLGDRITGVLIAAENGSDTIDVTPRDGTSVIVQGGNPGGGSDVLNYYAAGETTVELATSDIEDDGSAGTRDASFSGIEVLNVDAAASQFNVTGTDGVDEDITVTVYDADSGKVELGYAAQRAGQVASEIGDPVIFYSNTAGNAANFDLGDGDDQDTLVVIASTFGTTPPAIDAPQVIDVDVPARRVDIDDENDTVSDGLVTWEDGGIESVEAWGLEGDDTFYVTPGNIPVFIDGGDPIGTSPGDEINIVAGGDPVVAEVGPEPDEGGFVVGAHQRVSFDHIESLGVFQAAKAVIIGTGDDDEITIIARDASTHPGTDGVQDFTTTVNDSAEITWIDTPLIFVDGASGDDDITLRTPAPNVAQWDVEVFVAGGPASTPELGDRLRVETPYEDNDVIYQPTAPDAGIMEIWNTSGDLHSTIYIGSWDLIHGVNPVLEYHSSPGGVETLLYDGISAEGSFDHDNNTGTTDQNPSDAFTDTLTVLGDGFARGTSDDHFVHTPGAAPDAGSVAMVDLTNEQTMLGISYNNIGLDGTITINGLMGENSLAAMGTHDSDVMEISFPGSDSAEILLHTADGDHVSLLTANVASYELRTLEGDDVIDVQAPVDISGNLAVFGGGPSGSDALFLLGAATTIEDVLIEPDSANPLDQDVTGLGGPIDVSGMELITYIAVDDGAGTPDDMLTVDPGSGDQNVRVDDGPLDYTDRVLSDSLPEIQFTELDTFLVAPSTAGVNVVTFVTRALMGAVNYQADLSSFDALAIEGTEGADDYYTVTHPAGANVAITDSNSGVTVTELDIAAAVAGLRINTLGGDDVVLVDVGSDDLINVPMEYNGGGGSDLLIVSGDPATTVDEVIYAPGPALEEGRLTYEDDTDTTQMLIDFTGLEPVVDAVPAATLTVFGTDADNAIDYGPGVIDPIAHGLVTVDAYETIEFTNKGVLAINARNGDDVVSINNQETPTDLTLIEVDGGDPTASDKLVYTGSDEITVTQGTLPYDGTITNPPLPPVAFTDIEHVAVAATGADDTLTIEGTDVDERIAIDVGDAWGEGAAQVDSGFTTTFTGAEQVDVVAHDSLFDNLTINGRDAADRFSLSTGGLGTAVWTGTNESVPQPLLYITFGTDVEDLLLETLGGDDIVDIDAEGIAVSGLITVTASGDGPSGSDHLNFLRYAAGDPQVIVELDADPSGDLVQEISQEGIVAPVRLLGMETAAIDVESGHLYVAGTRADDVITYTPLSTDSGVFSAVGIPTVFAFDDVPEGSSEFVITGGGTGMGGPPSGGTADKVIVNGTSGSDLLTANVVTRNIGLDILGFGFPAPVLATWRSVTLDDGTTAFGTPGIIEAVTVDGMDGNDTFHVVMRDDGTPAEPVGDGLYVDIQGGSPRASDALVITAFDANGDPTALPSTDFVVIGKSRIPDSGNILVYQSAVRRPHISYDNIEVVSPNVASGDNLLTLGPDMYEENEFRQTAAILGTADVINLMNLSIFPNMYEHAGVPADQDWYAVKAEKTGTLDIGISFRTFPTDLLPSGGQLGIEVVDETGFIIAGDGVLVVDIVPSRFGAHDGDPDARVRFPAIAGQTYRFRVFGQTDSAPFVDDGLVVNDYDMTIINEAAPVPYDTELADIIGVSTVAPGAVLNSFSGTPSDTLSEVDDFYNGKYVYFVSGNLAGRRAEIADYVAVPRTFTLVAGGVSLAPSAGSEFLVETHDTGRSQLDDVTRDETPVIRLRLDDANLLYDLPGNVYPDSPLDESIRIPFNPEQTRDTSTPGYRVAVFIEGELQQPGAEPQVPIGYARPIDFDLDGIPDGIYEFDFGADAIDLGNPNGPTTAYPLTDGSHFLTMKVQIVDPDDPDNNVESLNNLTAFGLRSVAHEIVVDTMIPPVWFGDPLVAMDGLHPDSDTGIEDQPGLFTDELTSDTTPSFWGVAEADTIIYVYADLNDNDILDLDTDLLLGKTVAIPLDGTNQFPTGQWNMTTNVDMNDPLYFPVIDGTRTIFAIAEDVAGNIDNPQDAQVLDIFIDTRGPQVNDVEITTHPGYDLFDPKPSTDGPTPLVFSLDIDFIDRPPRDAPFVYPAVNEILATADGNIVLVGDYNGVIPIESIDFIDTTVDGSIGRTTVRLNFFDPLPDDRFTLTVSDRITDDAFNALDGESHVQEPQETPQFPSGDGVPGEDFIARFTVDSRPEVATYAAGSVWADTNGNTFFDPDNLDYTNRDIVYNFGFTSDDVFVGNFSDPMDDPPIADGFDKLAAYGRVPNGGFRWLVDLDNDGVPDLDIVDPMQLNGVPVAGNFDGNGVNGDEVGLYTAYPEGGSVWYFDTNHTFTLNAGSELVSDLHGVPIVGDFNGDGLDDLGTWQDDTFSFDLAPWDGSIDVTFRYGFIGVRERPVAADLDQDGYDDLGLWVPDRSGVTPEEGAEWYMLVSDGASLFDRIVPNVDLGVTEIQFTPVPFGPDLFMQFGEDYAMPLLGNFDPPVTSSSGEESTVFQVAGTDGDDVFTFIAGSDTITLNGVEQTIPAGTESVVFIGGDGQDTAFLRGSDGDDVFTAGPEGATLEGPGYSVTTQDVEVNHGYGYDGDDVATLNGSGGDDNFKADLMHEDQYAKMSGGGFYTRAKFFENVTGAMGIGDDDYARVWDSNGSDQMTASPAALTLTSSQFTVNVGAFDRLLAYSTYGGTDTVNLYDSDGDDTMRARSHKTLFWGPGFDMTLRGWEDVIAHSDNGGFDQAKLHDTVANDVVLTGDDWASLSTVVDEELDLLYAAYGFDAVKAYHSEGTDKSPDPDAIDFFMLDDKDVWDLQ
jgi:hypothetical protein